MSQYCLKCKQHTDTNNIRHEQSGSRIKQLGECADCGCKKCKFVSNKEGGSIVSKFIDNLPFEMHLMDSIIPPKRYAFAGPGTRVHKRLVLDENNNITKVITPPVNQLDECAMYHDVAYLNKDQSARLAADQKLLDCAERFQPKKTLDKINKGIVKAAMNFKLKTGQGLDASIESGEYSLDDEILGTGAKKRNLIYCGANKPKKYQKIGNMEQCLKSKQIRQYGLKKIDNRIISKYKHQISKQFVPIHKKYNLEPHVNKKNLRVLTTARFQRLKKMKDAIEQLKAQNGDKSEILKLQREFDIAKANFLQYKYATQNEEFNDKKKKLVQQFDVLFEKVKKNPVRREPIAQKRGRARKVPVVEEDNYDSSINKDISSAYNDYNNKRNELYWAKNSKHESKKVKTKDGITKVKIIRIPYRKIQSNTEKAEEELKKAKTALRKAQAKLINN